MSYYDERAVAYVKQLERALMSKTKLDPDHVELGALLNALECHVEEGRGHPDVVQCYQQALVTLASVRSVDPQRVTKATRVLTEFTKYLRRNPAPG